MLCPKLTDMVTGLSIWEELIDYWRSADDSQPFIDLLSFLACFYLSLEPDRLWLNLSAFWMYDCSWGIKLPMLIFEFDDTFS